MSLYRGAIQELEEQQAAVTAALRVLRGLTRDGGERKPRNLSAAGRKRIAEAQKRRWAKARTAAKNK